VEEEEEDTEEVEYYNKSLQLLKTKEKFGSKKKISFTYKWNLELTFSYMKNGES
jgi:hypothetical protein